MNNGVDKNEPIENSSGDSSVGLEPLDAYVTRSKAQRELVKARTAGRVALILVSGLVLSLPLYVFAMALSLSGIDFSDRITTVFTKWYDVMAPLVGAVIGALFGLSIANRRGGDAD
jgi:hypothetical protein